MEQYIVDGQAYNVKPEDAEFFLQKYPNAQKVETAGAPKTRETSWLKGEEGFIPDELQPSMDNLNFIKKAKEGLKDGDINSVGEFGYALYDVIANRLPSSVSGGWAEQGGLEEQLQLSKQGEEIDDETLQTIINNYNTAKNTPPSAAMKRFVYIYS